jgi:hypothetical protein
MMLSYPVIIHLTSSDLFCHLRKDLCRGDGYLLELKKKHSRRAPLYVCNDHYVIYTNNYTWFYNLDIAVYLSNVNIDSFIELVLSTSFIFNFYMCFAKPTAPVKCIWSCET